MNLSVCGSVELDQRLRDLVPGVVVAGTYQLVRLRGAGARSVVWEAFHTTLQRSCALKVIDASDPRDANLAANVRRTATLSHPNIVPIHDAFSLPEHGMLAVTMPLLEGHTLFRMCSEGRSLHRRAAARFMWQVADASLHMLALGYAPRNLGPEKVFISSAPAPTAKVLGLVKPIEGERWVGRTKAEREIVHALGATFRTCAEGDVPSYVDRMHATKPWQRPTLIEVRQLLADTIAEP